MHVKQLAVLFAVTGLIAQIGIPVLADDLDSADIPAVYLPKNDNPNDAEASIDAEMTKVSDIINHLEEDLQNDSQAIEEDAPAIRLTMPQSSNTGVLKLRPLASLLEPVAEPNTAFLPESIATVAPVKKNLVPTSNTDTDGVNESNIKPIPFFGESLDSPAPERLDLGKSDTDAEPDAKSKSKKEKPPKSIVYYTPLSAIAVFPVVKGGYNQSFYDLPILFSQELSMMMEQKAPGTKVMNPVYTVEEIKAKGLSHVYDKIMNSYKIAGRPDPIQLNYLLQQLGSPDEPISRVFFVEADLDISNPMSPKGFSGAREKFRNLFDGSIPSNMKYYVQSHVQVFDSENPRMPMVWNFRWRRSFRVDGFENMTPSVYQEADSQRVFIGASHFLGREILVLMPKAVYMEEHVDTSVQGQLASGNSASNTAGQIPVSQTGENPNETGEAMLLLKEKKAKPKRPVTETARETLYRFIK